MAFYFRKFRQSVNKIVPATKSFAYSARINEGDKTKDDSVHSKKWKCVNNFCAEQGPDQNVEFSVLSTSTPLSALPARVPPSVADLTVILSPRGEGSSLCPLNLNDCLHPNIAKPVPFTCDDILIEPFSADPNHTSFLLSSHLNTTKNTTLERVVEYLQPFNPVNNFNQKIPSSTSGGAQWRSRMISDPSSQWEIGEGSCSKEKIAETIFMSEQCPSFDGFLMATSNKTNGGKGKTPPKDGPSAEQLHSAKEKLELMATEMFSNRHDYSLLHKNIVFENNLFGDNNVKRGTTGYAIELLKLRLKIHTRFSSTSVEVLNTTVNEDTGVVRIHWRLKGLPQGEVLKFWRLFQSRETVTKDDWQWFEAFSYFHIGKDGMVHKHRIDRMLPGSEEPDRLSNKLRKLLNPAKPLVS